MPACEGEPVTMASRRSGWELPSPPHGVPGPDRPEECPVLPHKPAAGAQGRPGRRGQPGPQRTPISHPNISQGSTGSRWSHLGNHSLSNGTPGQLWGVTKKACGALSNPSLVLTPKQFFEVGATLLTLQMGQPRLKDTKSLTQSHQEGKCRQS